MSLFTESDRCPSAPEGADWHIALWNGEGLVCGYCDTALPVEFVEIASADEAPAEEPGSAVADTRTRETAEPPEFQPNDAAPDYTPWWTW
jgi:hypothetical protein